MYAFLGITTALLIFLSALLGYGRRQEIMANWKDHRFKPLIMLSAFLYKPDDDPRSRWQFAEDNFRDGVLRNVTAALKTVLGPLLNVFVVMGTSLDQSSKNVESVKRVTEATAATFERMFSIFEKRFISTLDGLRMTFFRLNTAMQRMWAAAVNSIWQAYSVTSAIMSTVDLIIKIVIIILVVLLAMLIFLFLFMWPVIPIILSVVGILVTAGAGAAVGGMASAFCFGPGALVCMSDGTHKSIAAVELGDTLADGGHVTAAFKFEGAPVRDLYGIPVTDEHLVFHEGKPIPVAEHPDVSSISTCVPSHLYCLNTSTHRIPIWSLTHAKQVLFADWEELEDNDEDGLQTWARIVFEHLNPGHPVPARFTTHDEALFHPETRIGTPDGPQHIRHIHPGMTVLDADGTPTRVTGVVCGIAPNSGDYRGVSRGAWIRTKPHGVWVQAGSVFEVQQQQLPTSDTSQPWISLFTEAGTFYLDVLEMPVRDFSDVGVENLHDQTDWVVRHMMNVHKM